MNAYGLVSMVVASGLLATVLTLLVERKRERRRNAGVRKAICLELQINIEELAGFWEVARDGESPRDLQLGSLYSRFTRGKFLPPWDQTMWTSLADRLPDAFSAKDIEELVIRQRKYKEILELRSLLAPHFEENPPHRLERISRPMWLKLVDAMQFLVDRPVDSCRGTRTFGNPPRITEEVKVDSWEDSAVN